MKIIVFAATKGGTGKTTLAYNVGIEVAKTHKVLLADLDPQASLRAMWAKRSHQQNPRLVSNIKDLPTTIAAMAAAGYQHEFMFVDTPGSLMHVIRPALQCADCIVLPLQASQVDWIAQEAIADLVDHLGLSDRTLFVVNRAEANDDMNEQTKDFFALRTANPIPSIRRRPEYKGGFERGEAGVELSREAVREVRDLWSAIQVNMGIVPAETPAPLRRVVHPPDAWRPRGPEGPVRPIGRFPARAPQASPPAPTPPRRGRVPR